MAHKAFTVRMPEGQAAELERVAAIDGTSVAEEIRSAIEAHIDERKADPAFQSRLRELIAENQKILKRLAQ